MTRIIYCTFLKKKTEGQKFQTYPGKLGKLIFNNISQEAWMQWQNKQTIIVNEKKLNMSIINDRKIIEQEMINFLFHNNENSLGKNVV